mgnify:CR=1 FL=1
MNGWEAACCPAPSIVDSVFTVISEKLGITAIVEDCQQQDTSFILTAWTCPAQIWSRLVSILRSGRNECSEALLGAVNTSPQHPIERQG